MEFFYFILAGLAGGILGGMGMGGGTVLIPILTIFLSVNQHTAQAVNLTAFIPMAAVALIIHIKNKLVDFDGILFVIIPAFLLAVLGSILSQKIDGNLLKRFFGGFLLVLSVLQFFTDKIIDIDEEKPNLERKKCLKNKNKNKNCRKYPKFTK